MFTYRRTRFFRSVLLPLTLVAFLSACHTWVEVAPPIEGAFAQEQPESIRLTLVSDSVLVVKTPTIEGDTLFGLAADRWLERPTGVTRDGVHVTQLVHPRLTVPLDQIRRVEARHESVVGAVLLGWVVVALVTTVARCTGEKVLAC